MADKVVRGKALVAKLRSDPKVRDPEALAAYLGRFKKARKAGMSVASALKVAKGLKSGGGEDKGGVKKSDGGKTPKSASESVGERLKRQRLESERRGREKQEQYERELSARKPGSVNLGNGIVSRKKKYEAKEDAYKWLEGKTRGSVEIFEITIPGKDREYVAVPKTDSNQGIEKKFPAGYATVDYVTESDAKRRRR